MTPVKIECMLIHNHQENRLFAICRTEKQGIVVSAADSEVVNNPETVIRDLVMSALQETDQFIPLMLVDPKIEVVDPFTLRFLLDSRVETPILMYRKCDHCHETATGFIKHVMR